MEVIKTKQVLHMNGGEGDTSYAKNSLHQKKAISKVRPVVEESIVKLFKTFSSKCFRVADLGCSSGPNASILVSEIIEIVDSVCRNQNRKTPSFQIFFNDLLHNDFNVLFKTLPNLYTRLHENLGSKVGQCFVAATPGSFYGRLFPENSIHYFHSSYSLHWLSQVPKGLLGVGAPVNKTNIVPTITSPPSVHEAYLDQFQEDFTKFLSSRAVELVSGGAMVLSFICTTEADDYRNTMVVLGMILDEMVSENLIEETKLETFNLPVYKPSAKEVKLLIEDEGSFRLDRLEVFKTSWTAHAKDSSDDLKRAKDLTTCIRAVYEPTLRNHFGEAIMDELFLRYQIRSSRLLEKMATSSLVISLTKNK